MSKTGPSYVWPDAPTTMTETEQIAWLQKEHAAVWFSKPDAEGYCVKIKVADSTGGIKGRSLGGAIANVERLRANSAALRAKYAKDQAE